MIDVSRRPEVKQLVEHRIHNDRDCRKAWKALRRRGWSKHKIISEFWFAIAACAVEMSRGLPDRQPAVFRAMATGRTWDELFPADWRESVVSAKQVERFVVVSEDRPAVH